MAVPLQQPPSHLWDSVLQLTKSAQDKNSDPLLWALQLSSSLNSAAVPLPSVELAHLLVSHICWGNHVPITWKFLEKALTVKIVPPMLVLALLATKYSPRLRICFHCHFFVSNYHFLYQFYYFPLFSSLNIYIYMYIYVHVGVRFWCV